MEILLCGVGFSEKPLFSFPDKRIGAENTPFFFTQSFHIKSMENHLDLHVCDFHKTHRSFPEAE